MRRAGGGPPPHRLPRSLVGRVGLAFLRRGGGGGQRRGVVRKLSKGTARRGSSRPLKPEPDSGFDDSSGRPLGE